MQKKQKKIKKVKAKVKAKPKVSNAPIDISRAALDAHKKDRGKIEVRGIRPVKRPMDLNIFYTPGVGAVASFLASHKEEVQNYTLKGRTVAIVSDGSAVLGLGNIGPEGALPVMEGKALLFKAFANVDAFPIVLATQDPDEIIETVVRIAPAFGGINLEDIAAPNCFHIEEKLKELLTIPVMHDDQHGTAIVVLAGLINAAKVVKKNLSTMRVGVIGAGAAGTAIAKLLVRYGVGDVIVVDRKGVVVKTRIDLNENEDKRALAQITNREGRTGGVLEALAGADVVVGVSGPGTIKPEHIRVMAQKPIVFALANPTPEIMPDEAKKAGAMVVATGRSDFPNQINNVLAFPGIFRGALDNNVQKITDVMKLNAAKKLAALVQKPTDKKIIPAVFDKKVANSVASVIK